MATPQIVPIRKKQYAHLVAPLRITDGPAGLYPEPRVWMFGADLAGFNAHFTYGFCKVPAVFHPLEGAVVHPYDECLVFAGTDSSNIHYLGAEVSIELGEEWEEHIFDRPSVVVVPKGTPHGPVRVRRVDKPIVHYAFGLAGDYKAETLPARAKTSGTKHGHLIKRLLCSLKPRDDGSGMDMSKVMDSEGVLRPSSRGVGPGNGDAVVWLYGDDLEGMPANFTWGLYSQCGKWHRLGEAHTHPEEEALVFASLEPNDLSSLGAELEMGLGEEIERHIFNQPTAVICPKAFPHLPLVTRWVDKPYGFFVLCLDAAHNSPWVK
jgi:hypothetical protein